MKVLFVCTGNAHRSPLAEALLKKLRPDLEVASAGLHVAIPISEEARRYLETEDAAKYLKKAPEDLSNAQIREYDLIVTMEKRHKDAITVRCPECESKILVWNIEDPYLLPTKEAENVYKRIKEKVTELAGSLQNIPSGKDGPHNKTRAHEPKSGSGHSHTTRLLDTCARC